MSTYDISIVVSVINGILDPNNDVRKSYVAKLDELRQNVSGLIYCLIKIIEIPDDSQLLDKKLQLKRTKTVALVLARKLMEIKQNELINKEWITMGSYLREEIKNSLVTLLVNENDHNLQLKICDLVNQIAISVFENDEKWDSLLKVILDTFNAGVTQNSNVPNSLHECALLILSEIFGHVYDILIKEIDVLLNAFRNYFKFGDLVLRTRTVRTISEMITYANKKELKYFHEFIFYILETTYKCLEAAKMSGPDSLKAENLLKYCLKSITDICSSYPVLFKKHFDDLFILMGKTAETKDFSDEKIREMAFEVIVNLVERRNNLFVKDVSKMKTFIELLYKYALEMDKEVTDDWATPITVSYFDEEFIYEENVSTAISFIDRLMEHLSCDFMLPHLSEIILQLLNKTDDFRYKYIGLLSISQVMNNVDDMTTIESIFPTIFASASDPSPKIRYASVNCINQMSDSFQPHIQNNYHDKIIPLLLERIASENILRVQLESIDALNSFVSHQTETQCGSYAEVMLNTLFGLFVKENNPINLQCEILQAIAEIAVTTDKLFAPYSEKSINILIEFFDKAYSSKTSRSLYGNLVECITLIGPNCWEVYAKVMPSLVKILVEITENLPNSQDPIKEYLQEAYERLVPTLKENFKELLAPVVNSVLKLVKLVPEMSISSNPEETFKLEDLLSNQTSLFDEPEVKIQSTSVKTSQTEDMAESLSLLNTTIEALQEQFIPYIQTTHNVVFPLLRYYINEEVRQAASNTLPLIMDIVNKHSDRKESIAMGKLYVSELLQIIEKEFDNSTLAIQMENLGEILLNAGEILNKDEVNILFSRILVVFEEIEDRRLKLLKKQKELNSDVGKETEKDDDEPDSDEENLDEIEKDIEEIEQIQSDIADVIGFLFKTHKELSGDIVNKVLTEMLPKYFRQGASNFEIKMGIFIADDMIEYLGQEYLKEIWNDLSKAVINFCDNPDNSIRQAACYGIGVFAQHTKFDFNIYLNNCLDALVRALAVQPSENEEYEWGLARDNAVASLGKIIKHQGSHNVELTKSLIIQWLKYLPITYDTNECPEQHELVCDILLHKSELILGNNNENLPIVLRILARVYMTKYSTKEINDKIENIFKSIKSNKVMYDISVGVAQSSEDGKIKTKLQKLLI